MLTLQYLSDWCLHGVCLTEIRKLAYKSWLGASGTDCHLTPKIEHLLKAEVAFKSYIRPCRNTYITPMMTTRFLKKDRL